MLDHPEGALDAHRQLHPIDLEAQLAHIQAGGGLKLARGLWSGQWRHGALEAVHETTLRRSKPAASPLARENDSHQSIASRELRARRAFFLLDEIGWNPLKTVSFTTGIGRYIFQLIRYIKYSKKSRDYPLLKISPILSDYKKEAGDSNSLYFLQDLACSQYILKNNYERHIDIGSRLDGFVAQICASRPLEVMDIRPSKSQINNINFTQADILNIDPGLIERYDLVTSLHALEHVGLGRYGDPIDDKGFIKGLKNTRLLAKASGEILISIPVASIPRNIIEFNAQRVFSSKTILETLRHSFAGDELMWWCACDSSRRPVSGNSDEHLKATLREFKGVGFVATSWRKK